MHGQADAWKLFLLARRHMQRGGGLQPLARDDCVGDVTAHGTVRKLRHLGRKLRATWAVICM